MTRQDWMDGTLADMVRKIVEERQQPSFEDEQVVRVSPQPLRKRRRRAARMFPDAPRRVPRTP